MALARASAPAVLAIVRVPPRRVPRRLRRRVQEPRECEGAAGIHLGLEPPAEVWAGAETLCGHRVLERLVGILRTDRGARPGDVQPPSFQRWGPSDDRATPVPRPSRPPEGRGIRWVSQARLCVGATVPLPRAARRNVSSREAASLMERAERVPVHVERDGEGGRAPPRRSCLRHRPRGLREGRRRTAQGRSACDGRKGAGVSVYYVWEPRTERSVGKPAPRPRPAGVPPGRRAVGRGVGLRDRRACFLLLRRFGAGRRMGFHGADCPAGVNGH